MSKEIEKRMPDIKIEEFFTEDLTRDKLLKYNQVIAQLKNKFGADELAIEWMVNLSALLQEIDSDLLDKIVLRITDESESFDETESGVYIGDYCLGDDYCFIWIEIPR